MAGYSVSEALDFATENTVITIIIRIRKTINISLIHLFAAIRQNLSRR